MIAIVDYGAGNLRSVKKAMDHLGLDSEMTRDPDRVRKADKVILPGVGHFAATARLTTSGLRDAISDIIRQGTPFLGICVGMQWLFSGSEEAPEFPGLGYFSGACARFPIGIKVPHVGWNSLQMKGPSRLLAGISNDAFVYFTHSFHAPVCDGAIALTDYDSPFASAIERDNVFGVQFHPEKSAEAGLKMLKNFGDLKC